MINPLERRRTVAVGACIDLDLGSLQPVNEAIKDVHIARGRG